MPTKFPEFFEALMADFAPQQIRTAPPDMGGGPYVTTRTLTNRLDKVCGPEGWHESFEETPPSLVVGISLDLPNGGNSSWKYGVGALVPHPPLRLDPSGNVDGGNSAIFKRADAIRLAHELAYAEAFKRACVKHGIGRYLYGEGLPDLGSPLTVNRVGQPSQPGPGPPMTPQQLHDSLVGRPGQPGIQPPPAQQPGPTPRQAVPTGPTMDPKQFIPPPTCGTPAVFDYISSFGKCYGFDAFKKVNAAAAKAGIGMIYKNWDQGTVNRVVKHLKAIAKKLAIYKGEFDDQPLLVQVDAAVRNAQTNARAWAVHLAQKMNPDRQLNETTVNSLLLKHSANLVINPDTCTDINVLDALVASLKQAASEVDTPY